MINKPMDVLTAFPVRKTKKQKQAFRDAVQSYVKTLGYECTIEKGSFKSHNVVIGNPETAKYLVTAHYDTPARLPFPNLITPCNFIAFLAYQLFMVAVLLLVPGIFGWLVGYWTDDFMIGFDVWYVLYLVEFILMMFGPGNKNNANDNTSGTVTVLETARSIPEQYRDRVCFVLFDLEEAGLVGSSSYQKKHKNQTKNQIILNCDCVGDGDELMLFPTSKLKKDADKMAALRSVCTASAVKSLTLKEKGFSVYPSDQKNFSYGVGIAAFRRNKLVGLYCDKIHTNKDTILEEENVSFLSRCLIKLITGTAQ